MTAKTIAFDQTDCTLSPGETIQHSGVYEICHEDESRATVILMRDTVFPFCRQCGENVRYKLVQRVPHISEDEDFSEPGDESPDGDNPVRDNPGYLMKIHTGTTSVQLGRAHGFRFKQDTLQTWGSGSESGDL